jgi:pimeloyl-ACP methyl ester carboxylesterase
MSRILIFPLCVAMSVIAVAEESVRPRSDPPEIVSSWDDLTAGIKTPEDWTRHREGLHKRFLDLIRDQHKPVRPPLNVQVHETVGVPEGYTRKLISYAVEEGERAHAYLAIPKPQPGETTKLPAIVVMHGTFPKGIEQAAGLVDDATKAHLHHLAQRGYVVIAPEHFVSGRRIPPEGAYDTTRFHQKHPEWTAVGKFTYEHTIAIDVLEKIDVVDKDRIGAMGHSLGGQGTIFLSAYDTRVKAAVDNCSAAFFRHNSAVEHWSRDYWYVYFKHIRPQLLKGQLPPIDFHEIMALSAPRAFLDVSALNDGPRLTQKQRVLMMLKVADVYEILGVPQNFEFFVHQRGHSMPVETRELMGAFFDAHLKPKEATEARRITPPEPDRSGTD